MKRMNALAVAAMLWSMSIGAVQAQAATATATAATAASPAAASAPAAGRGPMHGHRMDADNTYGWGLMSRAERRAHHEAMAGMATYDECRAYREQHHARMTDRAKERGRTMPREPRRDACAPLRK